MEYCLLLVRYRPPIVMATNPATTRITPIAEIRPIAHVGNPSSPTQLKQLSACLRS